MAYSLNEMRTLNKLRVICYNNVVQVIEKI